ncbi:hypothetical protein [Tenacibaculum sp. SG-28]|uniref:hypothetical protein n=1 Tax=Tenacibaculum sp. SG-28 TaxID=754426 RepID=UPI000CF548D0|nr:hypothetical protein [Tenacibaculum sp. SG-28]PQJ21951.1 hypothetical protein BSU00_08030 [Tenacibaculum sp. SG-28]
MKKSQTCKHCGEYFTPNRRGVQKYCSNSCRSLAWRKAKTKPKENTLAGVVGKEPEKEQAEIPSNPKDKISFAGIANATIGSGIASIVDTLLTPEENKPATKKDIQALQASLIKRYLPIRNLAPNAKGQNAYYDFEVKVVVYR